MEIRHQRLRLLLLYSLPLHIVAFGPRRLESLKGGYGSRICHGAMADYDEQEREQEFENHNFESRKYSLYYDEPLLHSDLEVFQGSLFTAGNFRIDSTMFGIDNPFDTLISTTIGDSCNGDDCEECFIPDEYKYVDEPVDVLMYIGIQRAKPIVATTEVDD